MQALPRLVSALNLLGILLTFSATASAQQKVFTTNGDFDAGSSNNTCHGPAPKIDCWNNTPDQLVLGRTRVSKLARVWADNYLMGWIVGIDSKTGRQFARFDSAIETINGKPTGGKRSAKEGGQYYCNWGTNTEGQCPGRVTTDTNGDVWIINRAFNTQGTLSKFSGSLDRCIDRNGNGIIETSNDASGDGVVDPDNAAEYFGQNDECILATIPLGGINDVPRGVAVDKKGKIWASTYNGQKIYRFNPNEPVALEATIDLKNSVPGCHPYSMATGKDYLFVSCENAGTRIHIDTLEVTPGPCPNTYGIAADPEGRYAYLGGWSSNTGLLVADFTGPTPSCSNRGGAPPTAVTVDDNGNIWGASYGVSQLSKYDANANYIGAFATGANPHGLSTDFNGRVWTVFHAPPYIYAHDINTGANLSDLNNFQVVPTLTGPSPAYNYDNYLYSDFTGAQIDRQAPYIRLGSWSGVHDALIPGTPWSSVSWNLEPGAATPAETAIVASVRAADTPELLGQAAFAEVKSGQAFSNVKGRFVEVKVDLTGPGYETPVLTDIKVEGPCGASSGVGCCLSDADCSPPDNCSVGSCPAPGQACVFDKKPDCCLADADCDDGNPCTTGTCPLPGGPCEQAKQPDCCAFNKDCDDNNACTVDVCSGLGGTCKNSPINGCCFEDKDCETGNLCLTAKCPEPGKLCELSPVPGCCSTDSDCNDKNACTIDACDLATNTCKPPEKVEDCCLTDGDCDDKNPCTSDSCSGPGGKCKHKDIAECCVPGGPGDGAECEPLKSPNDKPPCKAGVQKCNPETNKFECSGGVKPGPETCDGVDNDCDGEVDKGASLCAAGKACVKGQCAPPCKQGEFPCASGQQCENGYCVTIGGAGTGGSSGSAGAAGAATGGSAGAVAGGSAGAAVGGAAGASAGGSSGAAAGGSAGAVAGGSAGASAGGTSAGGKAGSSAGASSSGAAGKAGGGGVSAGGGDGSPGAAADSTEDGSCGCRVPSGRGGSSLAWMGALALGAAALRRRRQGRA